jgi:hypothetical protein
MADPVRRLTEISKAPAEKEAFESWLRMSDAVAFLEDNALEGEFVMYASTGCMFMHAVLVPSALVTLPDIEDLMGWDSPLSSWGIEVTFREPPSVSIVPPLHHTGSKTLDTGEQLVFGRSFEGRVGKKSYYEVLQKFTHLFDLHWTESRNAYCRLNKHGDVEDVIRVVEIPARGTEYAGTIVTFNRAVLDEYLVLTDSAIARMFDVTRCPSDFVGWSDRHDLQYTKDPDLFYKSHIEPGHASYMRGGQIVRSLTSEETVRKRHSSFGEPEERQYASFIAVDWKNREVREISTAPGQTANYFTKSNLPFEVSPAFFRPEVLSKYKADSEKYRLEDRSISCRGAWHLQTYDINEAGQVHTYIVYLKNLPYEEQLYWRAYNEPPKGGISKRAFTTDFEGTWHLEYDPLTSLKGALHQWDQAQVPWWTLRAENLPGQVHYPVTSSPDEWANEILQLDQLVVEGFEIKWLRSSAELLGRTPDASVASLKLAEECLIGLGCEESDVDKATAPLKKVHWLRSKLKGHASGTEAMTIRKQVLTEYGSFKKHFQVLTEEVDQSIRVIGAAFEKSGLPKSPAAASAAGKPKFS